jgi:hypothetical protein
MNRNDDRLANPLFQEDHLAARLSLDAPPRAPKGLDRFRARDVRQDAQRTV